MFTLYLLYKKANCITNNNINISIFFLHLCFFKRTRHTVRVFIVLVDGFFRILWRVWEFGHVFCTEKKTDSEHTLLSVFSWPIVIKFVITKDQLEHVGSWSFNTVIYRYFLSSDNHCSEEKKGFLKIQTFQKCIGAG